MSDVETQTSQRTVVAFISGLLIGGLLVWVFSSSPEAPKMEEKGPDAEVGTVDERENNTEEASGPEASQPVSSEGSVSVADQAAGATITLGDVTFSGTEGWVVVREYANNVSGNVLGAERYDTAVGLTPSSVELARATVKGGTYEVVFFTNEGAKTFSLLEDKPVAGVQAVFSAN